MAYLRNVQYEQAQQNYNQHLPIKFLQWAWLKGEKLANDKNE
jgi:hypothetical protein